MRYAAARRILPGWLVRHVYHFECVIESEVSRFASKAEETPASSTPGRAKDNMPVSFRGSATWERTSG